MLSFVRLLSPKKYRKSVPMVASLAFLGAGGLAGCGSVSPSYYALTPQHGVVLSSITSLPTPIEVRTPSVPARLDKDGIVRGTRGYRDHIIPAAAWSEPLGEMIGHVVAENLSQRLPGHIVFSQNDSIAVPAQVYIELSVNRFEMDAVGHAIISGILSAHRTGAPDKQAHIMPVQWVSPRPVGSNGAALVAALGEGLGVVSDQAIELLHGMSRVP